MLWQHLSGNKVKLNQQIVGSSGREILNLFDEMRTVSRQSPVNSGAHQCENTQSPCMDVQVATVESLESGFGIAFAVGFSSIGEEAGSRPPRNLAWWTFRQLCTDLLKRNSQPQGNSSQCYFAKLISFCLPFRHGPVFRVFEHKYFEQPSSVVQRISLKELHNVCEHVLNPDFCWVMAIIAPSFDINNNPSGSKAFWVAPSIFCSKQTFKHWPIQPGPLRSCRWDLWRNKSCRWVWAKL